SVSGTVAIEKANFVTRRLAARDALAATAMRATAFAVLLRALALDAVRTGDRTSPRRRPTVPIPVPPEPTGPAPALPVWSAWAAAAPEGNAAFAVVKSRASGRLDRVSVGLPVAAAADRAQAALVQLASWRGLPGWRDIEAGGAPGAVTWTVDSGLPFVDFDAVWSILEAPGRPGAQGFRAQARGGDWVGPTIGVDLLPRTGSRSVMVYTTTPLINRTGYLPRRLIEAEPLLEQGLALGLAFVNARSLTRGLASLAGR
ncbi:MAG TPA: hypothetical protein VGG33_06145, partial [Polyangia bacterium]